MNQKFNTNWKASKRPGKQRKYLANAPIHIKREMLSVNLSKELRKKHKKRNIPLRKGDIVKVMRGMHKKKQGKVSKIKGKSLKIYIEGIQVKKRDGSKADVPLKASNLQIIELNLDDKERIKSIEGKVEVKTKQKEEKINKEKQNAPKKT